MIGVLKNPFYAGANAYGKSAKRIDVVDGRARILPAKMPGTIPLPPKIHLRP